MGKILGLDYGERRIGVAIADDEIGMAFPRPAITLHVPEDAFTELGRIVAVEGVDRIVVGLPLSLSGNPGPQAQVVRRFIGDLEGRLTVPVDSEDERLTTTQAHREFVAKNAQDSEDSHAAAIILQQYLDRRKKAGQE